MAAAADREHGTEIAPSATSNASAPVPRSEVGLQGALFDPLVYRRKYHSDDQPRSSIIELKQRTVQARYGGDEVQP